MKFLMNNPFVIVIALVLAAIVIYFGWLLIQEIKLNNMLKIKHQSMRSHKLITSNKKRLGLLSSAALSPALAVLLFVVVGLNQPVSPSGDAVILNTENDILNVYETFSKRSSSSDLDSSDPGYLIIEDDKEVPVVDAAPNVEFTTEKLSLTMAATDNMFIYSVTGMTLISSTIDAETEIPDEVTAYAFSDLVNCGVDYQEQGLYADAEDLIVISKKTSNGCLDEGVVLSEGVVHVFDKDNEFALTDEFVVSGSIVGLTKMNNMVIVATKTEIDYSQSLDNYLPYMRYEGVTLNTEYRDIRYIEGTSPTTYITIFAFDLETKSVSSETVLVDSAFDVYLSDNAVYIIGNIFEFEPMSTYFEYSNPVRTKKVLIYEFVLNSGEVAFSKINIK